MQELFTDKLGDCRCCPRGCGVDRLAGETGFCGIDSRALVSHAGLHFGEEPPISGTRGSGTIFFAGCNLRCVFCQNYRISQEFGKGSSAVMDSRGLASEMLRLEREGAHNINFVSPSHMIFQMADAIRMARGMGLGIPVVYNSNGYDSVEALRAIDGLVDIWLPDLKYMDNGLAMRLSAAGDYADIVPGVLGEMLARSGRLEVDGDGVAVRGLLVRHLVLPGEMENSRRCLDLLASLDPGIHVSIMSQYSPQYRACQHPGINRPLTPEEYDEITEYALDLGLENAFIQELESSDHYLPDFDSDTPFGE
ncbi:MAG: radical SAM protein [Candidatus Krumholzibacteria bacterium]|nr:radical SAM protein [Candidatus Krumholzibacteria bacterium]